MKQGTPEIPRAARGLAFFLDFFDPVTSVQIAAQFGLVEATVNTGSSEYAVVADVLALLEIAVEQGLDYPILRPALAGELDQPMRIDGIGGAPDSVEDELDSLRLAGLLDRREDLGDPLLGAEFGHQVREPFDALGRHVRIELVRAPLDREVGGPAGVGALETAFADVAPGTDRVGDDGDVHGASIAAGCP